MATIEEMYGRHSNDITLSDPYFRSEDYVDSTPGVMVPSLPTLENAKLQPLSNGYVSYISNNHRGIFHSINPILSQLSSLDLEQNSQDEDALYEMAVKWELDHSAWLMEIAYNSPLNQLQLNKYAGINLELGGSSGSTGSSTADFQNTSTNTTPFSSGYAERQLDLQQQQIDLQEKQFKLNIFNSLISTLGSVTSIGRSVIQGFETIATMPYRISMARTQSEVASATKDMAVEGARLGNLTQSMRLLGDISSMFTPDSTDDEITNLLGSIGFSDPATMLKGVRQWHNTPKWQADYENDKMNRNKIFAYNENFTPEILGELAGFSMQIDQETKRFQLDEAVIQSDYYAYLKDSGYGKSSAVTTVQSNALNQENIKFSRQRLERDVEAYVNNIANIGRAYAEVSATYQKALADSRTYPDNPEYQMIMDACQIKLFLINSLGSQQLNRIYDIMDNQAVQRYMMDQNMTNGNIEMTPGIQKHETFIRYTFGDFTNTTDNITGNVTSALLGYIPWVGPILSQGANMMFNSNNNDPYWGSSR